MKTTHDYDFDLIVIGGGCNGTGIARDAAMRGIRTLLVEKNDWGSGTTGASSRMIHGGARYLLFDRQTTALSCLDSGYIQKIAPHLLFRIPFLLPYLKTKHGGWLRRVFKNSVYPFLMESYMRGYDTYQPLKNGKPHTHLNRDEALSLEPRLHPDTLGAITMDEWGIDPFRLCLLNALSASQHQATVCNHTEVIDLVRTSYGEVRGVWVRDKITQEKKCHTARYVLNATGIWSPQIAEKASAKIHLRPAKGTHIVLDRRISNWGIATNAIDGRQIFFFPDQNTTLIGTTDDDFYGDPDTHTPTQDEIAYLLQGAARVFPSIRQTRMIRAFSGIRPTLFAWGKDEDSLSRAHRIFDHANDGAEGLLSIAGGKLASYRIVAEEVVDKIASRLQWRAFSRTHLVPLPGGEHTPSPHELAQEFDISTYAAERLIYRHGQRAHDILVFGKRFRDGYLLACEHEPIMCCELRYVIQHEFVRHPTDLIRRTRLGLGSCLGFRCVRSASRIFCESFPTWNIDEAYQAISSELWKQQLPVLQDQTAKQTAIEMTLWP